jgi:predicted RNA binding protein YcfA (HicA-like mRNA interferase family)
MTGNEFLHALRKTARRNGVAVWIDTRQGKGSHVVVHYGAQQTTLKDRRKELPRPLLQKMLRDLGLSERDLG